MRSEHVPGGYIGPLTHAKIHPEQRFSFSVKVKALHHWIRKGDVNKARHRMIECVKAIKVMERAAGDCSTWGVR